MHQLDNCMRRRCVSYHQGRVTGAVVTYCFWWKSEIFLSAKPEVELILTIAPMENIFTAKYLEMVRDTILDSVPVRYIAKGRYSQGPNPNPNHSPKPWL